MSMKARAHSMFILVFLALSIALLSSGAAHAQDKAGVISQGFVPTAGVKGLPGTQSGSGPGCQGAGGFVPLECFQGSRKLTDAYNTTELGPFMNKVFVGAISLGAILAVLRLAWAGFVYMSSDLWTSKDRAKEIIRETLLGLFLLLAIWLILKQINPDILKLKINVASADTSRSYTGGG